MKKKKSLHKQLAQKSPDKTNKKGINLVFLIVMPLILNIVFTIIFYIFSDQFSYADPNKKTNLDPFLRSFFQKICLDGENIKVSFIKNGCVYTFKNLQLHLHLASSLKNLPNW